MAAANYAMAFALGRNPLWADDAGPIGGGDCTNFVSQALYAGGWKMIESGGVAGIGTWYATPLDYTRKERSKSWASARHFELFLNLGGRARPCLLPEMQIGDVMLEYQDGSDTANHVMIVTKVQQGRVYLSYHSTNRLNMFVDVIMSYGAHTRYSCWKILDYYPK